jgi:hypothetical protein
MINTVEKNLRRLTMVCDECGTCAACGSDDYDGVTASDSHNPNAQLEHGFKRFWRPIAAYVYLSICIFDFLGMPLYVSMANRQVNFEVFEELRKFEDVTVQTAIINKLNVGKDAWVPLTLQGGGLFHMSFMAIVGVAAFTRGREKIAAINSYDVNEEPKPKRRARPKRTSVTVTTAAADPCDEEHDDPAPKLRDI